MAAGYEALDAPTKARIANLSSYHSSEYSLAWRTGQFPTRQNFAFYGQAILRPLVKTHPETGRLVLLVTMHSFAVPGLSRSEGKQLLEELIGKARLGANHPNA